jgi:hypothetical protein
VHNDRPGQGGRNGGDPLHDQGVREQVAPGAIGLRQDAAQVPGLPQGGHRRLGKSVVSVDLRGDRRHFPFQQAVQGLDQKSVRVSRHGLQTLFAGSGRVNTEHALLSYSRSATEVAETSCGFSIFVLADAARILLNGARTRSQRIGRKADKAIAALAMPPHQ